MFGETFKKRSIAAKVITIWYLCFVTFLVGQFLILLPLGKLPVREDTPLGPLLRFIPLAVVVGLCIAEYLVRLRRTSPTLPGAEADSLGQQELTRLVHAVAKRLKISYPDTIRITPFAVVAVAYEPVIFPKAFRRTKVLFVGLPMLRGLDSTQLCIAVAKALTTNETKPSVVQRFGRTLLWFVGRDRPLSTVFTDDAVKNAEAEVAIITDAFDIVVYEILSGTWMANAAPMNVYEVMSDFLRENRGQLELHRHGEGDYSGTHTAPLNVPNLNQLELQMTRILASAVHQSHGPFLIVDWKDAMRVQTESQFKWLAAHLFQEVAAIQATPWASFRDVCSLIDIGGAATLTERLAAPLGSLDKHDARRAIVNTVAHHVRAAVSVALIEQGREMVVGIDGWSIADVDPELYVIPGLEESIERNSTDDLRLALTQLDIALDWSYCPPDFEQVEYRDRTVGVLPNALLGDVPVDVVIRSEHVLLVPFDAAPERSYAGAPSKVLEKEADVHRERATSLTAISTDALVNRADVVSIPLVSISQANIKKRNNSLWTLHLDTSEGNFKLQPRRDIIFDVEMLTRPLQAVLHDTLTLQ